MFCPRCGQQQASDQVRYCSRCGFSLRGVLAARRKDIIQGVLLASVGLLVVPFMQGVEDGRQNVGSGDGTPFVWTPGALAALLATLFIILGLARVIFALIVERNARRKQIADETGEAAVHSTPPLGARTQAVLPASESVPANFDTGGVKTAEMMPSVTEATTRHLNHADEPRP